MFLVLVLLTMPRKMNVGLHFMLRICHLPQTIKALFALSRIDTRTTRHFEPPEGGIFAASDSCFGYGIKKLHKADVWGRPTEDRLLQHT